MRRRLADVRDVPAFVIFGDVSLRHMAESFPRSMEEFSRRVHRKWCKRSEGLETVETTESSLARLYEESSRKEVNGLSRTGPDVLELKRQQPGEMDGDVESEREARRVAGRGDPGCGGVNEDRC